MWAWPDLESRHHRLVHRSDGYLRRQVLLGAFGGPAAASCCGVGVVIPPDFVVLQVVPGYVAGLDVARHGEHGLRAFVAGKHPLNEACDPLVELGGGGPGGQGEVQAVHQSCLVHPGEAPEGSLSLARAGLGLDDDQRFRRRCIRRSLLDGVGRAVYMREQGGKGGR